MIGSEDEARAFIEHHWGVVAHDGCAHLVAELVRENERQNLISRNTVNEVWVRHIADSAQLLLHAPSEASSWVDIGSGAGLPGLIIGILRPDLELHLVEPRKLRVDWLEAMCKELGLANCRVTQTKAEKLPAANYDVVSARAVANLAALLQLSGHLGGSGTHWLFAKGRNAINEIDEVPPCVAERYLFHVKHSLTAEDGRIIICRRAEEQS